MRISDWSSDVCSSDLTQLLNVFAFPDGTTMVDCPGYGYAKVSKAKRADWGDMIERYLVGREQLQMVMVLVDGEIGPTKLDQSILEWLRDESLPRSEEHTSELQSLMRISYAVFC